MGNIRVNYKLWLVILIFFIACSPADGNLNKQDIPEQVAEGIDLRACMADKDSRVSDLMKTMGDYAPVLNKRKTIGDFSFEASYQPHLFLAIAHSDSLNADAPLNSKTLRGITDYKNLHYIKFRIKNNNFKSELIRYELPSAQAYSDRIMYYSFYSNRDAYMIENGTDTLKGAFVNFERTFDVSPELNLTFVFERKSQAPAHILNFVFEDVIFNNGKLSFEFDYKVISTLNADEIQKLLL